MIKQYKYFADCTSITGNFCVNNPPTGVSAEVYKVIGLVYWFSMAGALIALVIIGFKMWQAHHRGDQEAFKGLIYWMIGCVLIVGAGAIVAYIFPSMSGS